MIAHAPSVPRSRWIRSPLTGTDGYTPAELDAAQARLGLPLPAALRDAYQLLGQRHDLTDNQDSLLAPKDLMGWVTPDDTDLPEDIAATFRRLPLPEYPISQQPGSHWYAHDEIILRDDRGTAMFRARTETAFDRFGGEDEDDEVD